MNLLDAVVTEIISEPYFAYDKWWVKVKYNCYGSISETELMFYKENHAKELKVGYTFKT